MENRYLFRGKRIDNGGWEIGSLIALPDGKFEIANKCENPPDSDPMWGKCVITHYVDPSTICQCTGLKDKTGKLIWENDIVVCTQYVGGNYIDYHIEKGYVEMKYGAFGLHRKQGYYRPFKDWLEDYEYEIKGNRFDNPELLEV